MKVCTDSCIFGAWLANQNLSVTDCLDIGTGTGLLSLLYAQKNNNCIIDALEIEENACTQASENFTNSPWKERLNLICTDAKNFTPNKKYDLILSNPPFFEDDLLSFEKKKNLAKHHEGLTLAELLEITRKYLSHSGYFAILLPHHRSLYFENLASDKFFIEEKLNIRHTANHNYFRTILLFSRNNASLNESELTIKEADGNYTDEFKQLLKDYYLQF